jgi:hypothetical protein
MTIMVGKTGNKELQRKFSEVEMQFDDANAECHKHADSPPYNYIVPKTAKDAEARCAGLHNIYTMVMVSTSTPANLPIFGAPLRL